MTVPLAEWSASVAERQARLAEAQLPWVRAQRRARALRRAEQVLAVALVAIYPALIEWLPLWARLASCFVAIAGMVWYALVRAWLWGRP